MKTGNLPRFSKYTPSDLFKRKPLKVDLIYLSTLRGTVQALQSMHEAICRIFKRDESG